LGARDVPEGAGWCRFVGNREQQDAAIDFGNTDLPEGGTSPEEIEDPMAGLTEHAN
jgi:hypothetical protein